MTLIELTTSDELKSFLAKNVVCVVTFSAHWCGPCKAQIPFLNELVPISVHQCSIANYRHQVGPYVILDRYLGARLLATYKRSGAFVPRT